MSYCYGLTSDVGRVFSFLDLREVMSLVGFLWEFCFAVALEKKNVDSKAAQVIVLDRCILFFVFLALIFS